MAAPDAYLRFLLDAGAHTYHHSHRTFYQHLVGTHDLLEQWGAAPDIRHAGLFHAIYGTANFRRWIWPVGKRDVVQRLIGVPAEQLVYLFGTSPPPRARYFLSDETPAGAALREMEAANLLEQGSASAWLSSLAIGGVSRAARAAIEAAQDGGTVEKEHAVYLRRARPRRTVRVSSDQPRQPG